MMNWFKRKKKQPRQTTFCYCPRCKNELIHSGSFVSDEELVTYRCSLCNTVTEWLFDAPAPILWTIDGEDVDYTPRGGDTMIYVTRPQQVEAIRYTGNNYDEMYDLTNGSLVRASRVISWFTLIGDEYNQTVDVGDWIVKYDTFECVAFRDKEFKEKFEEEQ